MVTVAVSAQTCQQVEHPWETYLNEVMTVEDVGTAEWEETYELLCELAQHPMDINQTTREQLELLPFLSAQQVEDIVEYLDRYRPVKSLNELQMIRSLDYQRRKLLACFLYLDEAKIADTRRQRSLKEMLRYGHSELMATGRIPLSETKGETEGYRGYPYRHWLKYQLTSGDNLKAGLVGSQDAGEPFFANKNRYGYDYYSYYFQLKEQGRLEALVLGNYRVSMGMGLVINNSFGLGKLSMLQSLGRKTNTLRAHSSRSSADYQQGAAATLRIVKGLTVTGFISHRAMDATLNKDGTAATILTSGYHRTDKELEKKNNLKNTTFGGSVCYQGNGLHVGLNAVAVHLNRQLVPNTVPLYRRHYAQGDDFLNLSTDYGYVRHRFSLNGETAVNGHGALATINSMSLQMGSEWSLMVLQRFYSYRYTSLYARCFSDGGKVQNESGLYAGVTWKPSPRWMLMAYSDYAYFPWARYRVSQSSHSWDNLLQWSYVRGNWTLGGRYRLRFRQRDNDDKTALVTRTEHRGRLSAEYSNGWSSRTQVDIGLISSQGSERGVMVSETLGFTHRWLRLNGGLGYYDTDSYDSRVCLYEPGPLYTYGFAQFSGKGIRYWLMARADIGRRLMLTAKCGVTDDFDSSRSDLDIQLRWKF